MSTRDEEFREFARSRAAPLHRSAHLLCGDWHLAHDLVPDTLVKAYRHWRRVQQADSSDAINCTTRTWSEMNLGGSSIPNPATDFLKVFKPSRSGRVRFVALRSSMASPPT
jgi:hypothetical protein